jgi:phosphatidate cytidylyltransferase
MISLNLKKRIITSIFLILLFFLVFNYNFLLTYVLIVSGIISSLEFLNITNKIKINKFYLLSINFFFLIYVSSFCVIFFIFSHFPQLKIILFSLLIGCVGSDMGGFVFGKLFKGPKLTKISPKKTISGAIGSIIFTYLLLSASIFYFTNNLNYKILLIAVVTSISCQIGDLFFSYLKRKVKIKDTGNFLPGHGGVLDRFDGIFFGIPIGFITIILFY